MGLQQKKKSGLDLQMEMIEENYIPAESERKKVVLYYFFVWIVITLSKKNITRYELFHLRQAIGWWAVFFFIFAFSMIWIFIPFLKFIPILLFLIMFVIWVLFVKQAWEGKYVVQTGKEDKILLPFFNGIWTWMLDVFDLKLKVDK